MKKIQAFCDSLCEPNPGDMHVGCWAKTEENTVLFTKWKKIGFGTCNEAEYHALFTVVALLEEEFKGNWPEVIVHSDSQLMTKQVNEVWKTTKLEMIALCQKAIELKTKYGFKLQWIPRENNSVADALAQEQRLKGSGRRYTMEDGRFRVHRNTPCVEIFADKEMGKLLHTKKMGNLRHKLEVEMEASSIDFPSLCETLQAIQEESTKIQSGLPKMNSLVQEWIDSTFTLLTDQMSTFSELAKRENSAVKPMVIEFLHSMEERPELIYESSES